MKWKGHATELGRLAFHPSFFTNFVCFVGKVMYNSFVPVLHLWNEGFGLFSHKCWRSHNIIHLISQLKLEFFHSFVKTLKVCIILRLLISILLCWLARARACVCVCVCVWKREREMEGGLQDRKITPLQAEPQIHKAHLG